MSKLKVAIFGAAGYSGEELIRLLLRHPQVEIAAITSRQYDGQNIAAVFPRFAGTDLSFVKPDTDTIAANCDIAFLALPHGLASEFAIPLLEKGLTVIDISADFRLDDADTYKTYYNDQHPNPALLDEAVYGLPERYRDEIKSAKLIACPGCYPTSIILALSPILAAGLCESTGIIASSMSGVSGAGRSVSLPFLYAECNESVRPYKVVGHRHTPEIEQELAKAAGVENIIMNFIPHLVPITRGIHSSIYVDAKDLAIDAVAGALHSAYDNEPFVHVLNDGELADTKHVAMTNRCEIGFAYDPRTSKLILSSAIDNLTKGASGQAVQCLNIIHGFDETTALL
ncbi:MAG: N-acetyl-gamma-glutamyl-phosphate reductase [Lentisphaeria bacterium]|nr:N-acetyl-gamma-glutamyl-phosphate reductase [Lentisphaeria bacterium]NQZ69421.1 N-acetyl-gamma-glutamyl-phosphate reductase [Lentisphaeria bacterium]